MSIQQPHRIITQPLFPTLLTDAQQAALARVQSGLIKLNHAVQRINGIIVDAGLNLRTVQTHDVGVVYGESLRLAFDHELGETKLRRAANAPERKTA